MGDIYLTDLADVLRAAGLTVIEVPGWQTRGRSTGGYEPGRPNSLMIHHTASPPSSDGWRDAEYVNVVSRDRPMCNLLIDRTGRIWVCAAGATNTNGKGSDTWGGGVPNDRMNEWAIGVEIANNGTGEPYPTVQQDAVMTAAVAICRRYAIVPHRVRGHFEWAPTRKIDPSGPSRWAPSGGKWSMDMFRADITNALTPPPVPPSPSDPEEVTMITLDHRPGAPDWTALNFTGTHLAHVPNGHADSVLRRAGIPRQTVTDVEVDAIIQSATTTTPCPPTWVDTPRGALWSASRGS